MFRPKSDRRALLPVAPSVSDPSGHSKGSIISGKVIGCLVLIGLEELTPDPGGSGPFQFPARARPRPWM